MHFILPTVSYIDVVSRLPTHIPLCMVKCIAQYLIHVHVMYYFTVYLKVIYYTYSVHVSTHGKNIFKTDLTKLGEASKMLAQTKHPPSFRGNT